MSFAPLSQFTSAETPQNYTEQAPSRAIPTDFANRVDYSLSYLKTKYVPYIQAFITMYNSNSTAMNANNTYMQSLYDDLTVTNYGGSSGRYGRIVAVYDDLVTTDHSGYSGVYGHIIAMYTALLGGGGGLTPAIIHTLTTKSTIGDNDEFLVLDSAASYAGKKVLGSVFNGKFAPLVSPTFTGGVIASSVAYKATPVTVTGWSYSGTTITLTVASHSFIAGDYLEVKGLTSSGVFVPNGIWSVTSVTSTTIVYTASNTPTGTASVSSATVKGYTTINGVGAVPAISVRRDSSNQTVTSGVATKVQFNFKNYDNTGAFDNATNYRFQPTKAGYYHIASQLACGTSVTQLALMIYLNGAEQKRGTQTGSLGATFVAGDLYLNGSTDYVEIYANLTGVTPAIAAGANYTYFDAHYITGA